MEVEANGNFPYKSCIVLETYGMKILAARNWLLSRPQSEAH